VATVVRCPTRFFANHRLARIYDAFDGTRNDLSAYLAIVDELRADSVLDVGCGTGSLAILLAEGGPVTQSGSDGALLRRRPLRTVRATRRGTRLKQATGAISGVQRCWFLLSVSGSAEAEVVNESGVVR
jgi:2-polyprenyl-3-methyl-5-hydroxy-6-metoxy-1,4-benzoquinol methylase